MNIQILEQGLTISIIGYFIVFAILLLLYLTFYYLAKLIEFQAKKRCKKAGRKCNETEDFIINSEVSAAISAALYLHFNEMHDIESGKLTVKTISRRYTPWNSKIYNIMNKL